ncbi:MAG: glycoside hydrolase family 31 protein [Beutenbergiaceae bacterium]
MPELNLQPAVDEMDLPIADGESWWGGAVADAPLMPFADGHTRDLGSWAGTNQSSPLLLSDRGRVLWSEHPFAFSFAGGRLRAHGTGLQLGRAGTTLREAFLAASQQWFPPSGQAPARQMFSGPQYNTWIQMPYLPDQEQVLAYVRRLLDEGLPPGVVMIDDHWSGDYGEWTFDRSRFADPEAMTAQLHAWGCSVMLWLVPWVSPDSAAFRDLEARGLLVLDAEGEPAVRRWWNGFSALLDASNPAAVQWLTQRLDALQQLGVDGFKFDGGDLEDYRADDHRTHHPVQQVQAWAEVGLRYPFNEYRACWRMGGQPLAQRLCDKPPSWGPDGLAGLIAGMVAQGLIGLPFGCPDLVGGGEINAVAAAEIDQEFIVRYTQVAALMPMIQFSRSPAEVLDEEHLTAVAAAIAARERLLPTILELVDEAARTGEPIVRAMAYHAPDLARLTDQFFLGPDIVVAPVLQRGATERTAVLPDGDWCGDDGMVVTGPAVLTTAVDLARLPHYQRVR